MKRIICFIFVLILLSSTKVAEAQPGGGGIFDETITPGLFRNTLYQDSDGKKYRGNADGYFGEFEFNFIGETVSSSVDTNMHTFQIPVYSMPGSNVGAISDDLVTTFYNKKAGGRYEIVAATSDAFRATGFISNSDIRAFDLPYVNDKEKSDKTKNYFSDVEISLESSLVAPNFVVEEQPIITSGYTIGWQVLLKGEIAGSYQEIPFVRIFMPELHMTRPRPEEDTFNFSPDYGQLIIEKVPLPPSTIVHGSIDLKITKPYPLTNKDRISVWESTFTEHLLYTKLVILPELPELIRDTTTPLGTPIDNSAFPIITDKTIGDDEEVMSVSPSFINPPESKVYPEYTHLKLHPHINMSSVNFNKVGTYELPVLGVSYYDKSDNKRYTSILSSDSSVMPVPYNYNLYMEENPNFGPLGTVKINVTPIKETKRETINFKKVTEYDNTRYTDESYVKVEGKNGYTDYEYEIYEKDSSGNIIDKRVLSQKTVNAVDEVVVVGTKEINTQEVITKKEPIAFTSKTVYDDTLWEDYDEITTTGVNGEKTITTTIFYEKGVEVNREVKESISKEPTQEIRTIGRKKIFSEYESKEIEFTDFKTIENKNPSIPLGTQEIKKNGVRGEIEVIYKVTRNERDNTESKEEISRTTLKTPIDEIIDVGTYQPLSVSIDLINPTNKEPVEGIKFTLYDGDKQIGEAVTDKNGKLKIEGFNKGFFDEEFFEKKITIKQSSSKEPYVLNEKHHILNFSADNRDLSLNLFVMATYDMPVTGTKYLFVNTLTASLVTAFAIVIRRKKLIS